MTLWHEDTFNHAFSAQDVSITHPQNFCWLLVYYCDHKICLIACYFLNTRRKNIIWSLITLLQCTSEPKIPATRKVNKILIIILHRSDHCWWCISLPNIRITCPCNLYPINHTFVVNLGYTGYTFVSFFCSSARRF